MVIRWLFLLLLALNLGAAAWLLWGRAPARAWPAAADPGVPELRLLTAAPPPSAQAAVLPAPAATVAAAPSAPPETCASLGPFTMTVDMRAAMRVLTPQVAHIQYREEQVQHSHGFWVYLPATATREAALDEARQLAAKGVHDYYVVTAGDTQNTVSLGLFDEQPNAQALMTKIRKLGFPAQVRQRIDTEPDYWIDYATPGTATFDWQKWLPGRTDLTAKPIDCFQ